MDLVKNPVFDRWKVLSKPLRKKVVAYYNEAMSLNMATHVPLSIAFDRVNQSRRTASPHMALAHNEHTLLLYFDAMNEVIMDVYTLVEIFHRPDHPWIFIGGFEHAYNIARFLQKEKLIETAMPIRQKVYVPYLENYLDEKRPEKWLAERNAYENRMMTMLQDGSTLLGMHAP